MGSEMCIRDRTQTVSYNKVELGQRLDNAYEVISGVPDNSDVVTTGQTRLTDGSKVQIKNNR